MRSADLHGLVPAKLDEFDRRLVGLMQDDGRLPFTAMATAVGLSHAAVRQTHPAHAERSRAFRWRRDASGHPRLRAVGHGLRLRLRRSPDRRGQPSAPAIDQVYYLVSTNGRYGLLAEVMAVDDHDLQALLMTIRAMAGVKSAESIPFVDTVKWVYQPAFIEDRPDPSAPEA